MSFDERSAEAQLDRGMARMAEATVEVLDAVARLDEARVWQRDGATSMTPWLAARYGLAWGPAREYVFLARRLGELPALRRAAGEGRISFDQLRPLARLVTPATEEAWVARGADTEPGRLWLEARRQERRRQRQVEDDHHARHLWMGWDHERRFLRLSGELPGEQGEVFEAAVRARAKEIVLEDAPLVDPAGARRADAVVELLTRTGDRPAPSTVVVHADAKVLAASPSDGALRRAETASGGQLADHTVRRLACDGRIEWHLEDRGRTVGIGRRGRQVSGWMMRALHDRDRGCRFPGCARTTYVHAHHLVHWAEGGRTDLDNLVLLCSSHHRLLHEAGWRTSGHPDHELRFHDPTGRSIHRRSFDLLRS